MKRARKGWDRRANRQMGGQTKAFINGYTQIARFMGPTWGPPGSCWPQMGLMLAHEPCYQGMLAAAKMPYTTHHDTERVVKTRKKKLSNAVRAYVVFFRCQTNVPSSYTMRRRYNAVNFLKYSRKTPHSSPVRARYGVSFVDPASD